MNSLIDFVPSHLGTLVSQSAKASVLVAVVALLCLLPRRWLPAAWRHVLWCAVFARLLLPDLPVAGWSWNLSRLLPHEVRVDQVATTKVKPDRVKESAEVASRSQSLDPVVVPQSPAVPVPLVQAKAALSDATHPVVVRAVASQCWSWQRGVILVWGAGTLAWWTALVVMAWRFRRRVGAESMEAGGRAQSMFRACLDEAKVRVPIQLRCLEGIGSPAVCGVFRPVILIPPALEHALPAAEFRLLLQHEIGHVKRRDTLVLVAASLLLGLHWWNPVLWYAWQRLRQESEAATDAWVLRQTGPQAAPSYGAMLLDLAASTPVMVTAFLLMPWMMGATGSGKRLRERLMAIMGYRPVQRWSAFTGAAMLCILVLTGFSQEAPASGKAEPKPPVAGSSPNNTANITGLNTYTGTTVIDPTLAVEGQSRAVYDQVKSAVVSVEMTVNGQSNNSSTGLIVSADGLVLLRCFPAQAVFKVRLSDGRELAASPLGYSEEWGVGVAKLNDAGPWPYVPLTGSAGVKAGQHLFMLAATYNEHPRPLPFFGAADVTVSDPGRWFATGHALPLLNTDFGLAFDASGRVVGVETVRYMTDLGCRYTAVEGIRSIWDELVAGKNVDQGRLMGLIKNAASQEPAAAKTLSPRVRDRAVSASVRIREGDGSGFSGTIITADGLVATYGRYFLPPGTKVRVFLPDGREVAAEVLGTNVPADVSLVRIVDAGPFPFVELGDSTGIAPGDACCAIGYGPVDGKVPQPNVRLTSVIKSPDDRWSHQVLTEDTLECGDSGGGLFDMAGRLIGVSVGGSQTSSATVHARAELFREHWDALRNPSVQVAVAGPAQDSARAAAMNAAVRHRDSIVEVRDGARVVALGTILSADGRIVTQASALPATGVVCRLNDGREFPATVLKQVREHNLTVLKIEAFGLPVIANSRKTDPSVGTLVTVMDDPASRHDREKRGKANTEVQPIAGIISQPARAFPSERGFLRANFEESAQGLKVAKLSDISDKDWEKLLGPQLLQKGDILLSLEGHVVASQAALEGLLTDKKVEPIAVAGDPVHLEILREGKKMEIRLVLAPHYWSGMVAQSARNSGFKEIYQVTAQAGSYYSGYGPALCGGPVLDAQGDLMGVAIAWRGLGWLFVLPAEVVRSVVSGTP